MEIKPAEKATRRPKNRLIENPTCEIVRAEKFRGEGVLQGRACVLLRDGEWLGWLPMDELIIGDVID